MDKTLLTIFLVLYFVIVTSIFVQTTSTILLV